jgi:hypothetical protein
MGSTKAVDSVQRGVVTRCFVLHPTIFSRLTHAHVPMLSLAKYLAAGISYVYNFAIYKCLRSHFYLFWRLAAELVVAIRPRLAMRKDLAALISLAVTRDKRPVGCSHDLVLAPLLSLVGLSQLDHRRIHQCLALEYLPILTWGHLLHHTGRRQNLTAYSAFCISRFYT